MHNAPLCAHRKGDPIRAAKSPSGPAFLGRAAAAFAVSFALLFVLLFAAYCVPGAPVRRNIARSVPLLQQEGLYPEYFGFKLFQMDNYTDTIMLFEAATADETDPLTAMMRATTYNVDNFETMQDDLAGYLDARQNGDDLPGDLDAFSYARYWHGYLIWLRPLLAFLSYGQVRLVQYVVLFALLALVLARLWKQAGWRPAVWFLFSQLAVSVFLCPGRCSSSPPFPGVCGLCLGAGPAFRSPHRLRSGGGAGGAGYRHGLL